ncbi:MAG: hypothetical protein C4550_02690 [Nitrospiraceae bacterium]|nr:MAG: hypothetical protein C4550_02690 [Nitrospiraceae bacterium]
MKYLICISAIVLLSWCPIVEGAEWLGEYASASIPGYEILRSNMMATGKEGGPTSTKLPMISDIVEKCKGKGA